jgi:hypothetical protein
MMTKDEQDFIPEELGRVFCRSPKSELPHLKSLKLERDILRYVCADQQSGSVAH